MNMLASEFEKNCFLINEHGKFHPTYECDGFVPIYGDDGEIVDYEYINLVITKTAEEDYQEWLADQEKPPTPQPNKMEVLEQQLINTQKMCIDLQKQILFK